MDELKEKYWRILCRTRKTGKIAQSVKDKEEAYWAKYPEEVVKEALQIHISRYPDRKESYTRGIIRNIAAQKSNRKQHPKKKFDFDMKQNYDFEALERDILAN